MLRNSLMFCLITTALLLGAPACSSEGAGVDDTSSVDMTFQASVAVDFHALDGDVEAQTRRGDIVYDMRKVSKYLELATRLRCVGLDPFASKLSITRLDAEGLESFLALRVEVAPYPNGEWTPLADFASLVTDQSEHPFDAPGFTIYYEGLDVLEAAAFDEVPQFELRVSSTVPSAVQALEVGLDLSLTLSSRSSACPGPGG